tara:strand:- start:133 stop:825 length:693 start_codon:yes stop_codon:yes gene_type:complete
MSSTGRPYVWEARLRPGKWTGLNGWDRTFRWVEIVGEPLPADTSEEDLRKKHRAARIGQHWYGQKDLLIVVHESRKKTPKGADYVVTYESWQRWAYHATFVESDTSQVCEVDEGECVHCHQPKEWVSTYGPCMSRPSAYDVVRRWEKYDPGAPVEFANAVHQIDNPGTKLLKAAVPDTAFRVAEIVAAVERVSMKMDAEHASMNAPNARSKRSKDLARKRVRARKGSGLA